MSDYVKRTEWYRLGELPRGITTSPYKVARAKWTGEKRPPKKGEWYLSGSPIEAYRAPNDLTTSFHIARVFWVEEVTTYAPIAEIEAKSEDN